MANLKKLLNYETCFDQFIVWLMKLIVFVFILHENLKQKEKHLEAFCRAKTNWMARL